MKFTVARLKVGDLVQAKVVEVYSDGAVLVEFAGDLVLVKNHSGKNFGLGSFLDLKVRALDPLEFRLLDRSTGLSYTI